MPSIVMIVINVKDYTVTLSQRLHAHITVHHDQSSKDVMAAHCIDPYLFDKLKITAESHGWIGYS